MSDILLYMTMNDAASADAELARAESMDNAVRGVATSAQNFGMDARIRASHYKYHADTARREGRYGRCCT